VLLGFSGGIVNNVFILPPYLKLEEGRRGYTTMVKWGKEVDEK